MRAQWLVLVLLSLLWSVNAITPSTPSTDVSDYELFFSNPSGCEDNATCQYFVGLRLNDNDSRWLDVYLSAAATEWVAVGFSTSLNMADSDVVGCTVDSGGTSVIALDTWNQNQVEVPEDNFNILDNEQDGIILGFSEFDDNRITCTLSRLISGTQDPPQDQNLNGSYYFLFGYKNGQRPAATMGFTVHGLVGTARPVITRQLFNPVTDVGELTLDAAIVTPAVPSTNVSDYELFFGNPSGCEANTTCQYFVGLRLNDNDPRWLDVYLSAAATEWVAVGFSTSLNMADSDVVGCTVDSGGTSVIALDTWNQNQVEVPEDNFNILDNEQDGIMLGFSEFDDNRITCTLSRLISGTQDPPQDQNLNGSYYFLFGYNDGVRPAEAMGFTVHRLVGTARPVITRQLFNPVTDVGGLTLDAAIVTPAVPAPNIDPEEYRLRRRSPSGCDPQSCDYFMGINTNRENSTFLDFYLTAEISGWVAVGFSSTANMLDADVVGCNAANGGVSADDAHNSAGSRINNADATNDAMLHSGDFTDGRITCVFSRRIEGSDAPPQDRPLNTNYFFLFGVGASAGVGRFPDHGNLIPSISNGQFNPATSEGEVTISRLRQQLLQGHGILMLLAWPVLAFTAIFFAAWMKPALPNGEWFQVHRAFHIAALAVAVIGFILAFVANMDQSTPGLITLGSQNKSGTAHFVFGIIIMGLQIVNPIISIFRCKPNGNYRWIFNLLHGFLIGLGVEFLAYINIGIGVAIFSETQSDYGDLTILWVYLAFAIFAVVLTSVLLVVFTVGACLKGGEGIKLAPAVVKPVLNKVYGAPEPSPAKPMEMSTVGSENNKPSEPPPRKPASDDAPLRWLALGVFFGVMLPLIFAVIIMIAATGNLD